MFPLAMWLGLLGVIGSCICEVQYEYTQPPSKEPPKPRLKAQIPEVISKSKDPR